MKTRKALAIIAACIGVTAYFDEPAYSKEALWARTANWTITGYTDTHACIATTNYPQSGQSLMIALNAANDAAHLAISGVQSVVGETYSILVAGSDGASGRVVGLGLGSGTVIINNINEGAISSLANSETIFIEGLGTFPLRGSKEAMRIAWECTAALNSI